MTKSVRDRTTEPEPEPRTGQVPDPESPTPTAAQSGSPTGPDTDSRSEPESELTATPGSPAGPESGPPAGPVSERGRGAGRAGVATASLRIASETQVNLQHTGNNARAVGEVLGAVEGAYIALRDHPHAGGSGLRALDARIGDTLIVRLFIDGVASGFRAQVLRFVVEPEYLLFLRVPQQVEQVSVRRSPRRRCSLPCEVAWGEATQPGLMVDISALGCSVHGELQADARAPAEGEALRISFALPGQNAPTSLAGKVRRVQVDGTVWRVGLAFDGEEAGVVGQLEPYLRLT